MTFPVLPDRSGELVPADPVVHARANCGRWIADCSRLYCRNAWALEYGQDAWTCNNCGTVNTVVWPPDPAAIEFMLMMRPDPFTRSWDPGQPIEQLMIENVANGIIPPELAEATERCPDVLTIINGRAVSGMLLPGIEERRKVLAEAYPSRFALSEGGA